MNRSLHLRKQSLNYAEWKYMIKNNFKKGGKAQQTKAANANSPNTEVAPTITKTLKLNRKFKTKPKPKSQTLPKTQTSTAVSLP